MNDWLEIIQKAGLIMFVAGFLLAVLGLLLGIVAKIFIGIR